jgi:hypothetical protein
VLSVILVSVSLHLAIFGLSIQFAYHQPYPISIYVQCLVRAHGVDQADVTLKAVNVVNSHPAYELKYRAS